MTDFYLNEALTHALTTPNMLFHLNAIYETGWNCNNIAKIRNVKFEEL